MSSALERAKALAAASAAAREAAAAGAAAPTTSASNGAPLSPTTSNGTAATNGTIPSTGTAANASPAVMPSPAVRQSVESPKLKLAVETLEKRCDDLTVTLEGAIAEIEAGALDPRLRGWLGWIGERRRAGTVALAVAGIKVLDRVAVSCDVAPERLDGAALAIVGDDIAGAFGRLGVPVLAPRSAIEGLSAVALVRPDRVLGDALALGTLRRDCAGLLWLAPKAALPADLADCFADAPLGVIAMMPNEPELAPHLARAVPDGALPVLSALAAARALLDLAVGIQAEHARENERLVVQTAIAERAKGARSFAAELSARKDLMVAVRDDLARDLQAIIDELSRAIAQFDAEATMRVPLRGALEKIAGLRATGGKLVHVHDFEIEERHQWWTGTSWERYAGMFPRKMRLTIPTHDVQTLEAELSNLVSALVAKSAARRLETFEQAIEDFTPVASGLGIDLKPAAIVPDDRLRYDRKVDPRAFRAMRSTAAGPTATLEERSRRAIDVACEKDVKGFHVDLDRKGPIGRIMEARTAVMGVSFLVMTSVRVSGAWGNIENWLATRGASSAATTATASGIPWTLIFNASILGVFFIFMGLLVNAITEEGKEGAVISEKVSDARDALEDKLVGVMERVVDTELADLKALLTERKAAALDRIDRAIDAKKQELEELDRRGRVGAPRAPTRPGLAPLPTSFRGDVDKMNLALRDVRTEFAARLAAVASGTAASAPSGTASSNGASASSTSASAGAASAASSRAAATPPPARAASPALLALQERAAKRAAEAAAAAAARAAAADATAANGATPKTADA